MRHRLARERVRGAKHMSRSHGEYVTKIQKRQKSVSDITQVAESHESYGEQLTFETKTSAKLLTRGYCSS